MVESRRIEPGPDRPLAPCANAIRPAAGSEDGFAGAEQSMRRALDAAAAAGGAMSTASLAVRVGADVTAVADVVASIDAFGDRYVRRVFTDHEIASCDGEPAALAAGLAARFAAKEATIKVLRPAGAQPPWKSIEVCRDPAGWCELRLSGEAIRMAATAGITGLTVSLSRANGIAAAVVVATGDWQTTGAAHG